MKKKKKKKKKKMETYLETEMELQRVWNLSVFLQSFHCVFAIHLISTPNNGESVVVPQHEEEGKEIDCVLKVGLLSIDHLTDLHMRHAYDNRKKKEKNVNLYYYKNMYKFKK
jgi:hypothetical protein